MRAKASHQRCSIRWKISPAQSCSSTLILGISKTRRNPTLQDQSNITPEGHDIDKGELAPSASDREMISAKGDFIELSSILHALKTIVEYPDDIAKHNEVKTTVKKLKPQQLLH